MEDIGLQPAAVCRMSDCGNIDLNIVPSDNLLLDCSVQNSSMIGANALATTTEGHVPVNQTAWKKRNTRSEGADSRLAIPGKASALQLAFMKFADNINGHILNPTIGT
ncbi:hypothetical protein PVAP13_6NG015919 [Panicum virgatum]|uniref:Uncharacterized protein n=1 Tax=Panicum virgatum TaxID=38727 RepID=A0A8T0QTC8_PANVG|nr:hypothetical protein PVAP13_6NG015919 [Panicum virgatum]